MYLLFPYLCYNQGVMQNKSLGEAKMSVFGERLRQLRLDKGELQTDVAKLLNTSVSSYSAYEGVREPSFERLIVLAKHYGVTTDYLTGYSNLKNPENQTVAVDLGLSERSIEVIQEWKDKPISLYLEDYEKKPDEDDILWSDVLNRLISTDGFDEFIIWLGKRLHPHTQPELSKPIQSSKLPGRFTFRDVLDALLQEHLQTMIYKMAMEKG